MSGWFKVSAAGLVRTRNEDALLSLPENGLFAISDGMGGASAGEVASQIITAGLRKMSGMEQESPGERKYLLHQTLHKVNAEIAQYAEAHKFDAMGATAVVLLLNPWDA